MHMIHDIATYADQENGVLNVVIDIPAGSNNKYEYDHDLGCFTLDFKLQITIIFLILKNKIISW